MLTPAAHRDFAKTARHVAPLAVLAEFAVMDVVAAMAIDALVSDLCRIATPGVAGRANQPQVAPGQREFRRLVMIESPRFPADRIVASTACRRCTERALVPVVEMAVRAVHPFGNKALVGVACDALHCGMFADQREASERVIESNPGLPVVAVVTVAAFRAKLAGMDIVSGVAGCAIG